MKIGGPGVIVEIDEAKFGRRKYNRGRRIEGQWVFRGFDCTTKNVFLVPVPSRDAPTFLGVIRKGKHPGSVVVSDCWSAYNTLEEEGFQHLSVNHSLNFVNPTDPEAHTQTIERTWSDVRGGLPRYGRRTEHFVEYLAEFLFKRRLALGERVREFCLAAAVLYRHLKWSSGVF